MIKAPKSGLRVLGILAMAFVVAHCGDSDVRVSTGPGVVPTPGTFTGSLSDGGAIRLEVGSIEEVAFTCDNEPIQETFSPPKQINSDGTFDVKFSDGGREFRVRGTFRDNNNVDGTIDDEDNQCDVSYDATRGGAIFPTVTPARTPTNGPLTTATPTVAPTSVPTGPTVVPTGPTVVPTGPTVVPTGPTASQTPGASQCPVAVEVVGNAGSQKVLDSGWTGLAHNATVISDGKLTFSVSCNGTTKPCGVCNVSGPIQNLKPGTGDINAHRCVNDTSVTCNGDTDCASGKCAFYFGAPLPLSAGGIGTCVTNQVNGSVSGTANVESGAFASSIQLTSRVFSGATNKPCPNCNGDTTLNDGQKQGTCDGGPRQGQPCDANGNSPIPSFGTTSLDCPPGTLQQQLSALSINLSGSSGTETKTLDASSPACTGVGVGNKKCFCTAQGPTPTQPNACLDDTTTPAVEGCSAVPGQPRKGQCAIPADLTCSPTETFRGCASNADCPASGDTCVPILRPCYLDNGAIGGAVTAQGAADPPDANGESDPTLASLFCIPPVPQSSVDQAGGLPGLGRLELPLHTKEIFTLPSP